MAPTTLLDSYKVLKRRGNFRRKLKKCEDEFLNKNGNSEKCVKQQRRVLINQVSNNLNVNDLDSCVPNSSNSNDEFYSASRSIGENEINSFEVIDETTSGNDEWLVESEYEEEKEENIQSFLLEIENKTLVKLTEWAITIQPTHHQLRELLKALNDALPFKLPRDPRTVLSTPRIIELISFEDGSQYWHHGLIEPLALNLKKIQIFAE